MWTVLWSLLSRLTNTSWWWRSGILDCLPWVVQLLSLWTLKMSMIVLPCSPSPATTPQSRYVNNYLISIDRPNFFFNSWFIWVHGFKFWRDSLRAFGIMGMLFVIFQCCWRLSKTFFFSNLEFVWTETTNRNCKFRSQLRKYIFLRDFSWHVHLQNLFFC